MSKSQHLCLLLVGLSCAMAETWVSRKLNFWHYAIEDYFPVSKDSELVLCNPGSQATIELKEAFLNKTKEMGYGVFQYPQLRLIRYVSPDLPGRSSRIRPDCTGYEYADNIMNFDLDIVAERFVSLRSSMFDKGTSVYVKELDGYRLPRDFGTHDGCLFVTDAMEDEDGTETLFVGNVHDAYLLKDLENQTMSFHVSEKPCNLTPKKYGEYLFWNNT